jgi:thiamine biosynthesis lipoprotein
LARPGATAKAVAADHIAAAAADRTDSGVLVSLGGDIAVAGKPPEGGWPIRIADDHSGPRPAGPTVALPRAGL